MEGVVWMMSESGDGEWRFCASIPQKLVHRRTRPFQIEGVWIDVEEKVLEISLGATRGGGQD